MVGLIIFLLLLEFTLFVSLLSLHSEIPNVVFSIWASSPSQNWAYSLVLLHVSISLLEPSSLQDRLYTPVRVSLLYQQRMSFHTVDKEPDYYWEPRMLPFLV